MSPPPIASPSPGTTPATSPVTATDIAGTATIRQTREATADTSSQLHLCRFSPEQRAAAPGTLSARELSASQAAARFLGVRSDVGEDAGVPRDLFQHTLDAHLGLAQLGRAAGQVEATALVGEMILSARLTEQNDRVFAHAESEDATPEDRAAMATYLASADLIYERQAQLQKDRQARATLRKDRQAAELAEAQEEAARLRARQRLQGGPLPER